jgi:hypothetical protein
MRYSTRASVNDHRRPQSRLLPCASISSGNRPSGGKSRLYPLKTDIRASGVNRLPGRANICQWHHLKVSFKVVFKVMADGTIEIITGRERRRRWSIEDKLKIVAQTL